MNVSPSPHHEKALHATSSDLPFFICMLILGIAYVVLIVAMLTADLLYTSPNKLLVALAQL